MQKKWKTTIESRSSWFDLNLSEVWQYRDLCLIFVRKNYITRYKQTIFGPLYMILSPLITSGLFTVVFGSIVGLGTGGIPQFLFYMSGNMAWGFFSSSCFENNNVFGNNAYIMGKVYFPRLTIPISNMLTKMISLLTSFLMILLFFTIYFVRGYALHFSLSMCIGPLVLLMLGFMGLGMGLIVSSLTIKYRDLSIITGFAINLLFYASPVLYPVSNLKGTVQSFALWNPVAPLLEVFRYVLFHKGVISPLHILWSIFFTFFVLTFGVLLFHRVEKTFIDTI